MSSLRPGRPRQAAGGGRSPRSLPGGVDPRVTLYLRYLAYVRAFRPLAVLIENVPDILHYGHHNVAEEIVEALGDFGYAARYSLINSAFHGVPQMRDRVYLIAYRRELDLAVSFPKATHHLELPPGYAGTRAVALRYVDRLGASGYVPPDLGHDGLPAAVSAEEAIGDLAPIHGRSVTRGARRFDELTPYRANRQPSPYAIGMRTWPGFTSDEGVWDHVIRYLPRDHFTFAEMRPGAEYPEAHATAAADCTPTGVRAWCEAEDPRVRQAVDQHRPALRRVQVP